MADLDTLEELLGVHFSDQSLLQQSLVHRSYLNENPDFSLPSNERLEFLGDALLGFVVAEKLYAECPDLSEGEMTKLRASLVRGENLARLASSHGLGDYLLLGHGEEASGGRKRKSTLAGLLEAIVGAVLVDNGFPAARDLVLRLFDDGLKDAVLGKVAVDYKSRLQEVIQGRLQVTPTYRTASETGPDHAREFVVEVLVGDAVIGTGHGRSKRRAEVEAARNALEGMT
ncbi:MAG: ribonuclease III [Chloroflexota bacterium]|nr:ribonuclease III [Chloroflexota bacterium]